MNVFHKLTLQSLRKNKTRTIVTIIGIILSAAMICAVTTFTSSFYEYMKEVSIYEEGAWHGRVLSGSRTELEKILASGKVKSVSTLQQLGYSQLEGSKDEGKPYLYVLGADEKAEDLLPIHVTEGRYPQSSEEILLPTHLATAGGIFYHVGDTLNLDLGLRMSDGFSLGQNSRYLNLGDASNREESETLEVREKRTYRVVGFYERMSRNIEGYESPGFTALTVMDENPGEQYLLDTYFTMNKPKETFQFFSDMGFRNDWNREVLAYYGTIHSDGATNMLISLAAIVTALIMFGSVSLIYNAFAISISERTKQFGLLTSIGATKKQLARMIRFEALTVSAIGIPLGVLSGIGGIAVTLLLIGDKFRGLGLPISMHVHVSAISVVVAVVVALVTVLISAWIPSRRAGKVSAVEAIRQNADIKTKAREVRTSHLTYRLFGLPGTLAAKQYKRSRKKYRATVVSLFMSIVLFVSAAAFTDYMSISTDSFYQTSRWDIEYHVTQSDFDAMSPETLLDKFETADSVTDAVLRGYAYRQFAVPEENFNPEMLEKYPLQADPQGRIITHINQCFVDDTTFRALLRENGQSEEKYFDARQPVGILTGGQEIFNEHTRRWETVRYFREGIEQLNMISHKEIDGYYYAGTLEDKNGNQVARYRAVDGEEFKDYPLSEMEISTPIQIGFELKEAPNYVNYGNVTLMYPLSMKDHLLNDQPATERNVDYCFFMWSDDHTASAAAIRDILQANGFRTGGIQDVAEFEESNRNTVLIVKVFSYGFIVLISLIAAANVFNTISTNMNLRRREFAMLQSVGMTKKGFHRMLAYESLLYGTKALLLGLPVSGFVTYLIWRSVQMELTLSFRLPYKAMGIATLSVFAVVFATMMYAMGKIKKESILETLKNENI